MLGFRSRPIVPGRTPNLQQLDDQVLAANATGIAVPFVVTGGPVLLVGLAAQSTGLFSSRIFLSHEASYIDNGPVRSTSLWGSAQFPTWVEPKYIPDQQTVIVTLNELSGAPNTISLTLYCVQAIPSDGGVDGNFGRSGGVVVYTADQIDAGMVVPANNTLQQTIRIEDSYDFQINHMLCLQTSPLFLMNIELRDARMASTGRPDSVFRLSNNRIRGVNLFGTQNQPFQFPEGGEPIARAGSAFKFDAQDTSGAPNTLRPVLIGQRRPKSPQ